MIGITRTVDSEGRLSIPSDLRQASGIGPKSTVEVILNADRTLTVRTHESACSLCGELIHISNFGKYIGKSKLCKRCLAGLKDKEE